MAESYQSAPHAWLQTEVPFNQHGPLADVGVADATVHFELFDAGHGGIDYRYPMSLAWLCDRMNPDH